MTDLELIKLSGEKDQFAFQKLVNRHRAGVISLAYGFVKNQEESEDIAQDVFVKIWQKAAGFKGDSSVPTWIHRITINSALNQLRKNKRISFFQDISNFLSISSSETPYKELVSKERNNIFYKAVQALPENQSIAINLRHIQGRSYQEIAEIMDVSVSSVESLLFRAKKNLKKKLSKFLGSDL